MQIRGYKIPGWAVAALVVLVPIAGVLGYRLGHWLASN